MHEIAKEYEEIMKGVLQGLIMPRGEMFIEELRYLLNSEPVRDIPPGRLRIKVESIHSNGDQPVSAEPKVYCDSDAYAERRKEEEDARAELFDSFDRNCKDVGKAASKAVSQRIQEADKSWTRIVLEVAAEVDKITVAIMREHRGDGKWSQSFHALNRRKLLKPAGKIGGLKAYKITTLGRECLKS